MIVRFSTATLAARAAEATGGTHVVVPTTRAGVTTLVPSTACDLGDITLAEFEDYRATIEAITIQYTLHAHAGKHARTFDTGWRTRGRKFEVTVTHPDQLEDVNSHFGARRYAYNWVVGTIKANLDARKQSPDEVAAIPWNFYDLRKRWNKAKHEIAPWWAVNSKETYAAGIADAVTALQNWSASKRGTRKGRRVGFPDFKTRHRDQERVRFTTGVMRVADDRRSIVLPVLGRFHTKESTRDLHRALTAGRAHVYSMTLSRRWGRLFISINYAERTPRTPRTVTRPGVRAGVDLGLRDLATVVDSTGTVTIVPNPAPLRATMNQRRRLNRALTRRIRGSRGYEAAKTKLRTLDRRAVHLRENAMHQFTHWLARTYGEIVVEDLDLAAMKRSMGRRAFRRSVSDAGLGRFRPMLEYKADQWGGSVIVADRWFPSSQLHHGCGCRLVAEHKLDKLLACARTGELVDRDQNAARNLRDYPDQLGDGSPVRAADPHEIAA